jgi:hypothetical protein
MIFFVESEVKFSTESACSAAFNVMPGKSRRFKANVILGKILIGSIR